MLYQSLSDELRRLVAQVPQGYAYGIWSWLEKRFQSTEQDHVGDLWDEFTKLVQEESESFDMYKARVDRVYGLLVHAKDKPSPGLYAHRLLWKLSPRYNPAVLALKASGKLKDASAIDWSEIVSFVNNHERSQQRLAMNEEEEQQRGFAAMQRGSGSAKDIKCYNCGKKGHMARSCKMPRNGRESPHEGTEHTEDNKKEKTKEVAHSAVRARVFYPLTSDEEEDDNFSNREMEIDRGPGPGGAGVLPSTARKPPKSILKH